MGVKGRQCISKKVGGYLDLLEPLTLNIANIANIATEMCSQVFGNLGNLGKTPHSIISRRCARWDTRGGANAFALNFYPLPNKAKGG